MNGSSFAKQFIFIVCCLKICKCTQKLPSVNLAVIKWNHKLCFIISFNLFFCFPWAVAEFFSKVPSLVYKLEICKERMLFALTHSGVCSLLQALLMTKYAMNLENLQPCRGGKLLSGLLPVFVCVSSLPLDLFCTKLLVHSRAVAQVCAFRQECSLSGISFCKTLLLSSLYVQKYVLSPFWFFSISPKSLCSS